jgi:hypothetical protein
LNHNSSVRLFTDGDYRDGGGDDKYYFTTGKTVITAKLLTLLISFYLLNSL